MNIRGLGDFRQDKNPDDDKDKKKETQSYTGGEKSGLAVENPDEFGGAISKGPIPENHRTVHLYRNGFTVDEGEFRPRSDPQNEEFMKAIEQGYAPEELSEGATGPVNIALVDKRGEDYDPRTAPRSSGQGSSAPAPVPARPLFAGEGMTLGGGGGSAAAAGAVNTSAGSVAVDPNRPTTSVQIRFHNGQRQTQQFNQDATVGQLRAYMQQVAPVNAPFRILEGFPPKVIAVGDEVTLKDAGLLNAAVTQKI